MAGNLLHQGGHAFIALAAGAQGPVHGRVAADFSPRRRDFAEIVGEDPGGSRSVGTMNHGNVDAGQRQVGIQAFNRVVVPGFDFAQVDLGQHVPRKLQLARLDARQVNHRHDPAHGHGELRQAELFEVFRLHRGVGRPEVNGLFLDLGNPAARPDRLVIHLHPGGFVVVVGPIGVKGFWKRRPGACNVHFIGGTGRGQTTPQELKNQDNRR